MGWGTTLFCGIYYSKQTYKSKDSVIYAISKLEKDIEEAKAELTNLVYTTEFSKFFEGSKAEIRDNIKEILEENFSIIENSINQRASLLYLLENWDSCHTKEGKPIEPPSNIEWDTAYIEGDFIND